MSRRTLPRWLPASAERILNAQLEKARIDQKSALGTDSLRPQNTYETWMKGKEQRLRDYQKTHDELAKIDKKQADEFLARMLQFEEQNAKSMLAMAKQGGGLNQMVNDVQARANKTLQDLEARLRSLSPEQRAASAYIYLALDGVFPLGQVVQPGTAGATAVVYPNPDFYDHTLPAWEAQSICVNLSTGPASKGHYLYPTIVSIWNSLDWDAIANVMK